MRTLTLLLCGALLWPAGRVAAQGVTTASITGVVKDAQGAVIPGATIVAIHEPSGTSYDAVSQPNGRFVISSMRVGGPYKVTASLPGGFTDEVKDNLMLQLGVSSDVDFTLNVAALAETVVVSATPDAVFSSTHTGAETAVTQEDLDALPTVGGRIDDIARLSPQCGGSGTFVGQDYRANNPHGGWLVFQQLVRPWRAARRSNGRRADFTRGA